MAAVWVSMEPDRPSTALAISTIWASSPCSGRVDDRMEEAVSFVRRSWMIESVAVLMPRPVLAMVAALALIWSVARIVRARSVAVTSKATSTTARTAVWGRYPLPFLVPVRPIGRFPPWPARPSAAGRQPSLSLFGPNTGLLGDGRPAAWVRDKGADLPR